MACNKWKTCIYGAPQGQSAYRCDYLAFVGHSRGCPADNCIHYEKGKRPVIRDNIDLMSNKPKKIATFGGMRGNSLPRGCNLFNLEDLEKMHAAGMTDKAIADALRVSPSIVYHWRKKKLNLPNNYRREKRNNGGSSVNNG